MGINNSMSKIEKPLWRHNHINLELDYSLCTLFILVMLLPRFLLWTGWKHRKISTSSSYENMGWTGTFLDIIPCRDCRGELTSICSKKSLHTINTLKFSFRNVYYGNKYDINWSYAMDIKSRGALVFNYMCSYLTPVLHSYVLVHTVFLVLWLIFA